MLLRGCAVKWVAGSPNPAGFKAEENEVDAVLDPAAASALPAVLLSLLYPDAREPADIARLAGASPDSEWRATVEIGKRRFRLTRSYAWASTVLEAQDAASGEFTVVARGGDQCRTMLGRIFPIASRNLVEALCFVASPLKPPAGSTGQDDEVSRIELVSASDMYSAGGGSASVESALDETDRLRVATLFQAAKTREFVDEQVRVLSGKLADVSAQMGGLVDSSGELARVVRALAEVPRLRALTPGERDALTDTEKKRADLERHLMAADEELALIQRSVRRAVWYRNVPLIAGTLIGVVCTVYSFTGGIQTRKFALANILFFGIALAGALRHIASVEARQRAERRRESVERRREAVITERSAFDGSLARATRELGVTTLADYEARVEKRRRLEERERALTDGNRAALDQPEYIALEQQKRKLEIEIAERRGALQKLESTDAPSEELQRALKNAGWDPNTVLWETRNPVDALLGAVTDLTSVAATHNLLVDGALMPALVESWGRLARHVTGEPLTDLNVADGKLTCSETPDPVRSFDPEKGWALVETLRLSVLLSLLNANVPGIPGFIVRINPFRFRDPVLEANLRGVYAKLASRLQVVLVDAG